MPINPDQPKPEDQNEPINEPTFEISTFDVGATSKTIAPVEPGPKPAEKKPEQQPTEKTKNYFEYRLESAESSLEEAKAELLTETDAKKIEEINKEIADEATPAIKKYKEILAELELGRLMRAKEEAEKRLALVKGKIEAIERENPRAKLEWMREHVKGYGELTDDYDFIKEVLAELNGVKFKKTKAVKTAPAAGPKATGGGASEEALARMKEVFRSKAGSQPDPDRAGIYPPPTSSTTEKRVINPEVFSVDTAAEVRPQPSVKETTLSRSAAIEATAPVTAPEAKTEEEEDPLAETVGAEIENITGKIEAIEISNSSKQVILDFLTEDAREGYKMFALEWFRDHEDEIRKMVEEREGVMRDDNDWKVKTVLGAKDVGGMGVLTNEKGKVKSISKIENGRYAKYGEVLDKIGILKIDMARDPIPPETPYLLLNYLQKSLEGENQKIEVLIMEAVPGDKSAEAEISAIKEQLKKLYLARKEIADKLLRKDLTQLAEEKIAKEPGFKTKEQQIEEIRAEKEQESHAKLMDEEWVWFCGLPLAQKAKLWEQAVEELPVDAKISPILPPETEENKQKFVQGILAMAAERGVTDPNVFYGLLEQGYKPYFVAKKPKLRRFFITDVPVPVVIPNKDSKKDYKSKDEDEGMAFIKKVGEDYSSAIKAWAETFGKQIEEKHNRKVREEVEEEIYKLANSPVVAVANAGGYFEKRRKVLLDEAKKRSAEPKK